MTINTILLDFDGVIRHWQGTDIRAAEREAGLAEGALFAAAFDEALLLPVITGKISHAVWVDLVQQALTARHGSMASQRLIAAWHSAQYHIDSAFLAQISAKARGAKLVLVTNATSKLSEDLHQADLLDAFDLIINSSVMGVAKPEIGFYNEALKQAATETSRCLFIDDSPKNVQSAQALGICSLLHVNADETLKFIEAHCR